MKVSTGALGLSITPLMMLGSSALCGCGGGPVLVTTPEPPPEETAPGTRPARVLAVAGPEPEHHLALGPFDCAEGVEISAGGRRLCMYNHTSSWPDAEARCEAHGGHLATIKDAGEGDAVFAAVGTPPGASTFWIGLTEPSEGQWLWADATRLGFSAWNPGEPNNDRGNENCGEWLFPRARWNDLDCALTRPFLCETKRGAATGARRPPCAREFTAGTSAYCLVGAAPATWEQAQRACSAAGGNLAVIETAEENEAIARGVGVRPNLALGSLWIGLNDRVREGDFRWIGGEPVGRAAWRAGEPNNAGDEDCVEWSPADGQWNDLRCSAQLGSLCESPQGR
jgi:hypothetical protein